MQTIYTGDPGKLRSNIRDTNHVIMMIGLIGVFLTNGLIYRLMIELMVNNGGLQPCGQHLNTHA